jgi:hypothetical protein
MDEGTILLVNLVKGKIGEDAAGLLGSLLASLVHRSCRPQSGGCPGVRMPSGLVLLALRFWRTNSTRNCARTISSPKDLLHRIQESN